MKTSRFVQLLAVGALALTVGSCHSPSAEPSPAPSGDSLILMARCLEDRGWPVDLSASSGTFHVEVPDGQSSAFEKDSEECATETGFGDTGERFDADGASRYYDQLVAVEQCLEEHGYTVGDPPSRQSFVDDYLAGGSGGWMPYSGDPVLDQEQIRVCEQPND